MKKFIGLIILLAVLTVVLPHVAPVRAAEKEQVDVYEQQKLAKSIVFIIGMNQYFVNDQVQSQDTMDTAPFIENDRTFVPIRYLGHALGINDSNIAWDNNSRKATLTLGSNKAEMIIGQEQIVANGAVQNIDVAPLIKNNRTHLPARYVAEALGYQVDWDTDGYVIIWPQGQEKPDITPVKQQVEQQQSQQPVVTTPQNEIYVAISKSIGAVNENGLLVFYEKGNASGQEAFFIQKSNKYDYLVSISSYSDESLNTVKEALTVYYPTGYNTAFEKLKSTINTGSEVKLLYFDDRYFGVKKFEDGSVIYVGSKGVKY